MEPVIEVEDSRIIEILLQCALACDRCASQCLNEPDINKMVRSIKLTQDCADICIQGARLWRLKSEMASDYLLLCERICRLCAEECLKHEHDHCQRCAEVCQHCAELCRESHGS